MKRLLFSVFLLAACAPCAVAQSVVFVVRHAEKADAGAADAKDPDPSHLGRARAERLAQMLRDTGITAIYASEFKRTQQTAQPTAKLLRADVGVIAAKDTAALAAKLSASKEPALVVGHSNTVPDIIKALGVTTPVSLSETDYDNLFVVIRQPESRLLRLHY